MSRKFFNNFSSYTLKSVHPKSNSIVLIWTPYFSRISSAVAINFDSVLETKIKSNPRRANSNAYAFPMPSVQPVITKKIVLILITII